MSAELTKKTVSCVFVHGWAMNSALWQHCIAQLPDWIDAIRVDLPGHGTMRNVKAGSLDDYVREIVLVAQRPAIWVGWSLGGLAVLRLAQRFPERVAGLFMVACNPCFTAKQDWPGLEPEVLEQFADALQQDVAATIRRFLALQVRGSDNAMHTVRELQQLLKQRGQAEIDALQTGLHILANTDLSSELVLIDQPMAWYLGGRDTLVPVAVVDKLKKLQPGIEIMIEQQAGHAPFVSHPQAFVDALIAFARRVRTRV